MCNLKALSLCSLDIENKGLSLMKTEDGEDSNNEILNIVYYCILRIICGEKLSLFHIFTFISKKCLVVTSFCKLSEY